MLGKKYIYANVYYVYKSSNFYALYRISYERRIENIIRMENLEIPVLFHWNMTQTSAIGNKYCIIKYNIVLPILLQVPPLFFW